MSTARNRQNIKPGKDRILEQGQKQNRAAG